MRRWIPRLEPPQFSEAKHAAPLENLRCPKTVMLTPVRVAIVLHFPNGLVPTDVTVVIVTREIRAAIRLPFDRGRARLI